MKKYFIDKLTDITNKIESTKNRIVLAATEMDMKALIEYPSKLQEQQEKYKEILRDFCKYCSVSEVIEVSNLVGTYSKESLNLVDKYQVEHFYKYSSEGISVRERDMLIERFGYSLKEAKVK